MMSIPFAKYSACGNDFILIDNRQKIFASICPLLIRKLCRRRLGIGADGVIFLENAVKSDFGMRIFNTDGSEAEMCGNGIRCLGKFIQQLGFSKKEYSVQVQKRLFLLQFEGSDVSFNMGPPTRVQWSLQLPLKHENLTVDYLDTGVPHTVIFTHDLQNTNLAAIAPEIRDHPLLGPKGTNVNFAHLSNQGDLYLRTYERGVEEETLGCGTGAAAVAIAAARKYGLSNPLVVKTRSGEKLTFHLTFHQNFVQDVRMKGPATLVYQGKIAIPY